MTENKTAQPARNLEPCPFCGSALYAQWGRLNPKARCRTEGCKGAQLPALNLDVPADIDAWNTRPLRAEGVQARNWTEDFQHENGNYLCKCVHCGEIFHGHKRRVCCKACDSALASAPVAGEPIYEIRVPDSDTLHVWHEVDDEAAYLTANEKNRRIVYAAPVVARQYFYRMPDCAPGRPECRSGNGYADCPCWHDVGAGPLAGKEATATDWRNKPGAPVAGEAQPVAYQVRHPHSPEWFGCDRAAFDVVRQTRPADARALYAAPQTSEALKTLAGVWRTNAAEAFDYGKHKEAATLEACADELDKLYTAPAVSAQGDAQGNRIMQMEQAFSRCKPPQASEAEILRRHDWGSNTPFAPQCSCPSGDGSLHHPCAVHPASEGYLCEHLSADEVESLLADPSAMTALADGLESIKGNENAALAAIVARSLARSGAALAARGKP